MSERWPDPHGYWEDPQARSRDAGGYQPPPGYHSGGWTPEHRQRFYAPPGYGGPYSAPYPQPQPPSTTSGSTIGALIVAIITMLICSGTNVVGVVLACIALGKSGEPREAAKLTRYAWISNWIHLGIIVLIAAIVTVAIVTTS